MVYNIKYKQAGYKPITAIKSEKRYTYKERNMLISQLLLLNSATRDNFYSLQNILYSSEFSMIFIFKISQNIDKRLECLKKILFFSQHNMHKNCDWSTCVQITTYGSYLSCCLFCKSFIVTQVLCPFTYLLSMIAFAF